MQKILLAAALTLGVGAHAAADDDLWFGVKAGTLGLGLEATWRPVPYLDLRAGYNAFSYEDSRDEAGIAYDGELDLSTGFVTANLRMPLSPFRVTAGVFSNGNEVVLNSRDGDSFVIGSTTYQAADLGRLEARSKFDSVAPYAGVGLDFRVADTVGISLDAGVLFQGDANVVVNATGPIATDPTFQNELDVERQELEDAISDYEHYPVVSLAFTVNF
ncbi:MAG: hypothetical protein AAF465_02790 [Pseudomonadota bacterium]